MTQDEDIPPQTAIGHKEYYFSWNFAFYLYSYRQKVNAPNLALTKG
jgi:hypothetical protein